MSVQPFLHLMPVSVNSDTFKLKGKLHCSHNTNSPCPILFIKLRCLIKDCAALLLIVEKSNLVIL